MNIVPNRVAIAQIAMHWTTHENVLAILRAMTLAKEHDADICAFSELAITGFHREIAREARPEVVLPALAAIREHAGQLRVGVAVGAPTFNPEHSKFISHLLIDERGNTAAEIRKRGLTGPEATFFAKGEGRPTGIVQGMRCSAVICREIEDHEETCLNLSRAVDLIYVPGALRQDPEKPKTDPPEFVRNIQRLAVNTKAYVVHTNWPNALNRPEESVDGGGSVVASPGGEVLFRLPMQASGVGIFNLGDRHFEWYAQ